MTIVPLSIKIEILYLIIVAAYRWEQGEGVSLRSSPSFVKLFSLSIERSNGLCLGWKQRKKRRKKSGHVSR